MKLFWWKIYFWLNVVLIGLVTIIEFSYPSAPVGLFITDLVIYGVGLAGVYSYIFRKEIFEAKFWKYFFWFNILYSSLFLLYAAAPNHPIISYLSFLSYSEDTENLLVSTVIGLLLSLPYMFAMYQLAHNRFLMLSSESDKKLPKNKKWGMFQTALWGYSIIFIAVMLILSLIPNGQVSSSSKDSDLYSGMIIFAPIFIFWAWIAVEYKKYEMNWWKVTLLLNSLLFSGIIVFGSFFYDPLSAVETSSEFDWIGVAQTLIIITGLYVFGSEQFEKKEPVEEVQPRRPRRRRVQTSSETAIGK